MKQCLLALVLALHLAVPVCATGQMNQGDTLSPSGLLALEDGSILVADSYHRALWRMDQAGSVTRLAGREGVPDLNGAPLGGYQDDVASKAVFAFPWAVVPFQTGYALSDRDNHAVRYLSDQRVYTLAGSGKAGFQNGTGSAAAFDMPTGLALSPAGLYVADTGNHAIRLVSPQGKVTTVAGGEMGCADGTLQQARFHEPTGLYYTDGVLYVADTGNHRVCKIVGDTVTTVVGGPTGEEGFADGDATRALLSYPQGLIVGPDGLYIADTGNGAVRLWQSDRLTTLAHPEQRPGETYLVSPRALALWSDTLLAGDVFAQEIFILPTTPQAAANHFADLNSWSAFTDQIAAVTDRGLMVGTGSGIFSPDLPLTRGMLATILAKIHLLSFPGALIGGVATFSDVTDAAYYAAPVSWAADQGLVAWVGEDQFHPDQTIDQGELLTALFQHAATLDVLPSWTGTELPVIDDGLVPAYSWAIQSNLIQLGDINPKLPISRGSAACLLADYLALMNI